MKTKTGIVGSTTLIASLLVPMIAQASLPITRQTQDAVTIYDDGSEIKAFGRTFSNSLEGYQRIEALEGDIDESLLRTTDSRFTCEVPKNPYCDGSGFNPYCDGSTDEQTVFPDKKYASKWIGSCFDERTVYDIELDLATAMENTGASRGFYQFEDSVEIRRPTNKRKTEEREVYYTIVLDKNNKIGEGHKSGVVVSESEYAKNIYITYENSGTVDLLDGAVSSPNSGELTIYEMSEKTPEDSNLRELESFKDEIFDTERLKKEDPYFEFKTDGVKNVLGYASLVKEEYNPDVLIVDYHNPISLKKCAVASDGSCLPDGEGGNNSYFKPKINIFTTDRTYYRNVCSGEGVKYTQTNKVQADVNSYVERYIITQEDDISDKMTDNDILSLNRLAPYKLKYNEIVEVDFHNSYSGFDYNTDKSYFEERVTEYLGKNSISPDNTLMPTCTGESSYDDKSCYDKWNNLHHDHYKKPLPDVEDISIVDVIYEEKVKTEEAHKEEGEDGSTIDVPAQYEWKEKNTCNTHNGTRRYNINDFCDGEGINCTGYKKK